MASLNSLTIGISAFFISSILFTSSCTTHAVTLQIGNNCPFTVWAAAVPGGGKRLDRGQYFTFNVAAGTTGRMWGRTNCTFDKKGRGHCETGDCNGVLKCKVFGTPPYTVAEYALNKFNNSDFYDMSLVEGFNLPIDYAPITAVSCKGLRCLANIKGECPSELKVPGGCNNPCTVFKTDEYCCNSGKYCGETNFSRFFKTRCPDAYSYPKDDQTSQFTCPISANANYRLVLCP
jgi:hypothetical protein